MVTPWLSVSSSMSPCDPSGLPSSRGRTVLAVAALLLSLLTATARRAEARPVTEADTALRAKALVHAAAMAALLEGHPGEPMRALDDLDAYRTKQDKPMRALLRKLFVIRAALDESARADWDAGLKGSAEGMRLVAAVVMLRFKHRNDPAVVERLERTTSELKKMLEDAQASAEKPAQASGKPDARKKKP